MKTVRMVIEVDYEEDIMYGNDREAEEWFFNSVMATGDLVLHSNEIGDTVGIVKVISIQKEA